jgi:rubrerythrin
MVNLQEFANDLRNYFICCPVYFSSAKGTFTAHITNCEQDTLTCKMCGAKWNRYIVPLRGLEWAELVSSAMDGRGKELLGKRLSKKQIRSMTQEDISEQKSQPATKEIIKEKEIITKVQCNYCHSSFNEVLEKCPNCGAQR